MIDLEKLRQADRRTLGRAITLLESSRNDHRTQAEQLLEQIMPYTGNSLRIGITGVPGVGKSTFIDTLGKYIIEQGHKLAVLTIDPTSTINGGSILGDKTRMNYLSPHASAYIRPSPSGNSLGGVARRTREAILICEAAGFDIIIVETVGVGQSETLVSEMTDIFLLMLLPGGGDELQGIKRGIMELADIAVVNKADGDMQARANITLADVQHALHLIKPKLSSWTVPVLAISALKGQGITQVWEAINDYQTTISELDVLSAIRQQQSANWLKRETADILMDKLQSDNTMKTRLNELQQQVRNGTIVASVAARKLADQFLGTKDK